MKPLGSPAAVAEAIRADARAECERIQADLARELDAIARAPASAPPPDREARLGAARREARELAAREDIEDRREALEAREAWMRAAVEEGMRRLHAGCEPAERRERLLDLAVEALRELSAARGGVTEAADLVVSATDFPLLDAEWRSRVESATGLPPASIAIDPSEALDGGCGARTKDGRVSFDNSFAARARRLEPVWRAALADVWARR